MKILLVNDDGIFSERLQYAYEVLKGYGDIVVVAPKNEQSGKSASITIGALEHRSLENNQYYVIGTPADCVTFALFGLGFKPDIVISGINRGYNIGIDTLYSGTVGAALHANYHGYKAVAFSGDYSGMKNIERYFKETLDYIFNRDLLSKEYILNINLPKDIFKDSKGFKHTQVTYLKTILEGTIKGSEFISFRKVLTADVPENSDVFAFKNGYISISKIALSSRIF